MRKMEREGIVAIALEGAQAQGPREPQFSDRGSSDAAARAKRSVDDFLPWEKELQRGMHDNGRAIPELLVESKCR